MKRDVNIIIICAFRYALGTLSYIVGVVCDYIKDNIDIIDNTTIKILLSEILEAKHEDGLGMDCNQREWLELFDFLKEEERRRLNDHFDLIKKEEYIKELQDEVDKYKHEYYPMCDLFENPQAYEFEDLKIGMWIWDKKEGVFCKIVDTLSFDKISVNYHFDSILKFEENRFYPVQMANARGDYESKRNV